MGGPGAGGTVCASWLTMHYVLVEALFRQPRREVIESAPIMAGFDNRISPYHDPPARREGSTRSSILARYNAASQTQCSVPADLLAVTINLSGLGLRYAGSTPLTPDDVYFLSVALALAAGEEAPLFVFGGDRDGPVLLAGGGGGGEDPPAPAPSWLPRPLAKDTTLSRFTLHTLGCIHRLSRHELELDLVFFEREVRGLTPGELEATRAVFPDVVPSTPPPLREARWGALEQRGGGPPGGAMPSSDERQLDAARRAFLATAAALGPVGAARLWAAVYRDVVRVKLDVGMFDEVRPNEALRGAAGAFLSLVHPAPDASSSEDPSLSTSHGDGNGGDESGKNGKGGEDGIQTLDLESALLFLTCLTDPRWNYFGGPTTARVLCTRREGSGAGYAVLSNFSFSQSLISGSGGGSGDGDGGGAVNLDEIRLAMPTDLIGSSCLPPRLWLLQPVVSASGTGDGGDGPGKRWRVVGKGMLLGEPDLWEELSPDLHGEDGGEGKRALTLGRNQIIVG